MMRKNSQVWEMELNTGSEGFLITNNDDNPNISPVSSDVPVIDLSLVCDGNEEEIKKLAGLCLRRLGIFPGI
ncbi:hypothetical protein FRX31_027499 [Thalictrum thalictroides]|uniref:Uncharacterized protein n=1 Tax=Thalictrum thalictroides TaxID=46969 RepID=A0A7J6VFC1_THATH|nr:hypothetical protein FRX31_027499 [Thalictrum thalictroides]